MSIFCKLFGHKMPRRGWWGDGLYGRVGGGYRDGTGRTHFTVSQECPRCGEEWVTARFHGSQVQKLLPANALKDESHD